MHFTAKSRDLAKRLRSLEGRLAPDRIAELARSPAPLRKGAQNRRMSFLTCRIRGFAGIAESLSGDPAALSMVTRRAITPLARVVLERGGTIDRMAPGFLTAFFNAPLDDPRHAFHACECALAMLLALEKVNHALEQHARASGGDIGPLAIGIGVNTGEAVFGDFGTEDMPRYAVAGGAADWADKLENLSADYGTAILAGSESAEATEKTFAFLEVDLLSDAPEATTKPVYALLGTPVSRANPKFLALKTFHGRIFAAIQAREWDTARALIDQARALSGANPVLYDLYFKRIAEAETRPLSIHTQRAPEAVLP